MPFSLKKDTFEITQSWLEYYACDKYINIKLNVNFYGAAWFLFWLI